LRKHFTFKEIVLDLVRREKAKRFILDGLESGALWPKFDKVFAFDQIVVTV